MALVVEDGSGLSTAESYLSVAATDTYNLVHANDATWIAASTGAKEIALREATQYLEATYFGRWQGSKYSGTQALSWPREDVELDGWELDRDTLPQKLLDATAELAVRAVSSELMPDQDEPGGIAAESVVVGPIEVSTTYAGAKSQAPWFRLVDGLLRGLVMDGSEVLRG